MSLIMLAIAEEKKSACLFITQNVSIAHQILLPVQMCNCRKIPGFEIPRVGPFNGNDTVGCYKLDPLGQVHRYTLPCDIVYLFSGHKS